MKSLDPILMANISDLEILLEWKITQNHTKRWGAIKGRYSCQYSFMHEEKEEVVKWVAKNYK